MATGDYDQWFIQTLGRIHYQFKVAQPYLGEVLPARAQDFDAVLVTGSPLSVTRPTKWMVETATYLREAGEKKVPVLGICFGHQLLGLAYHSKVIRNPKGRETGTITVTLTEAGKSDPIFSGAPPTFFAQATHEDVIDALPNQATLLAYNSNSGVQAMAIGKYVRSVQFHPEARPENLKAVITSRAMKDSEELIAGLRPTPYSEKVLSRFLTCFT